MSLKDRLKTEIAEHGPMSVAAYMTRCLHDPLDGYYATRPALGEGGDFITAPLVSQMFGELLGLWAAETWRRLGRPAPFCLIEIGPGDGTLMSDALRAARLAPDFLEAAELVLVETSSPLIELQKVRLAGAPLRPSWVARLSDARRGPFVLIANELLDCLPVVQSVRTDQGWRERCVGLDAGGELVFGLGPWSPAPPSASGEEPGLVWEASPAQEALGEEIGALAAEQGGCALLIDYGRDAPGPGDTLQALRAHRKVDPLACPGEADLTVWADFPTFRRGAERHARTALLEQGELLRRLGIVERAEALSRAQPDLAPMIGRQLERLASAQAMGSIYKACAVFPEGFAPPGFEQAP
jgi:SAM-dependent MidA family methyltransferase